MNTPSHEIHWLRLKMLDYIDKQPPKDQFMQLRLWEWTLTAFVQFNEKFGGF